MEVDPIDRTQHLIEANVVESLKTCAIDLAYTMVRHQELLFPTHEHVFPVRAILVVEVRLLRLFRQRPPSWEACPVLHVLLVAGTPIIVSGLEGVFGPDDLAFEKGSQGCVFGSEACVRSACAVREPTVKTSLQFGDSRR